MKCEILNGTLQAITALAAIWTFIYLWGKPEKKKAKSQGVTYEEYAESFLIGKTPEYQIAWLEGQIAEIKKRHTPVSKRLQTEGKVEKKEEKSKEKTPNPEEGMEWENTDFKENKPKYNFTKV